MPEYRPQPWYRTKQAVTVLAAAAVVAVVCGGWLVLRSPSTTAEQSKIEAPTSAPPAPSSAATHRDERSADRPAAPRLPRLRRRLRQRLGRCIPGRNGNIRSRAAQRRPEAEKPEIGATRTPATRAPISVAPVPRPVAGSDSSTPGDAPGEQPRRRGCFGFC